MQSPCKRATCSFFPPSTLHIVSRHAITPFCEPDPRLSQPSATFFRLPAYFNWHCWHGLPLLCATLYTQAFNPLLLS